MIHPTHTVNTMVLDELYNGFDVAHHINQVLSVICVVLVVWGCVGRGGFLASV